MMWVRDAARHDVAQDGTVKAARLVLGGNAPAPIEVKEAAEALLGFPLNEERMQAAAESCYRIARPLDNTDFIMNWRKQMTREYTLRALNQLTDPN
jgi:CO/xanthine dehydrogenase FAD-binding subunit